MDKTLHQPSTPAHPLQRRRIKLGPVGIALLLALLVSSLGLAAWTAVPGRPLALAQPDAVRAAREYLVKDHGASPSGSLQEILALRDLVPTHRHSLLGRRAPHFELADHEGKVWNLQELLADRPVVLIFYYGFHCIHCVRHLYDLDRDLPLFRELGAQVVAISADPPERTRQRFQQSRSLGFPVLFDPEHKVALAYGAYRWAPDGKMPDMLRHATFLIDRDGAVGWVNVGDMPLRRNSALLYQLDRMKGGAPP